MSADEIEKIKRMYALKETDLNSQIKLLKNELDMFRETVSNLESANKTLSDECMELRKNNYNSNVSSDSNHSNQELEILRKDMLRYKIAYEKTEAKNKDLIKRLESVSSGITQGDVTSSNNTSILQENEYLKNQLKDSRITFNKLTTESEHLKNKFEELSKLFLEKDKEIEFLSKEIVRQKDVIKKIEINNQNTNIEQTSLKKTVLLVEDSLIIRTVQKNILESIGFDVVVAKDVPEAKSHLEKSIPDLAIIDVDLSEPLDGLQVAKDLQLLSKKTPFLLMLSTKEDFNSHVSNINSFNIVYKDQFKQDSFIETVQSAFTLKFN